MKALGLRVGCIVSLLLLGAEGVLAQAVVPDGTVGTAVTRSLNDFTITGGSTAGTNLFHSFQEFSIPTGGAAIFNNATTIQTIFSRVTGGSVSNIDGAIRANGSASLFLLNPSGILFGPNASLNIGGSFVGTTANSIKFADGMEFSATTLNDRPLLTMSVPIGLQMGTNPEGITVKGTGHRITGGFFAPINTSQSPIGLQVGTGNTLALIGGAVNFDGGVVSSNRGGHLEVGSVSDGQVRLNSTGKGWLGDYSAIQKFNDIYLAQQSSLDASGSNGSIQLQGRNINLTEGSAVLLQNQGAQTPGGITVRATESLNLMGNVANVPLGSFIRIDNLGTGQTGDIIISAANLLLQDGGRISTATFSPAPSGNITVDVAGTITVTGAVPTNRSRNSTLSTNTFSTSPFGKAGDLTLSAGNLRLLDSGSIASATFRAGPTGRVQVNVRDLTEIAGYEPTILAPSALTSSTIGSGNADLIVVNTAKLLIRDGGLLGSIAAAQGSSSEVIVNASDSVVVQGKAPQSVTSSRIASTAEILDQRTRSAFGLPDVPSGDARSLTINTPSLQITDKAFVSVKNDGSGIAGIVEINANVVSVSDLAQITARNDGTGIGGNLDIRANSLTLRNGGNITAATAYDSGGNITLTLQESLLMRSGSLISATAGGRGDGGNITLTSPIIVGLENSDIVANAIKGRGGSINITTQGIIGLAFRNTLTPRTDITNDITASSEFNVNGTVQINNIGVDPTSGLVNLPVDLADASQQIAQGCSGTQGSSFVVTGRGGIPLNPMQQVRSDRPWTDTRNLTSDRGQQVTYPPKSSIPAPLVEATGWRRNAKGNVEVYATTTPSPAAMIVTCAPWTP